MQNLDRPERLGDLLEGVSDGRRVADVGGEALGLHAVAGQRGGEPVETCLVAEINPTVNPSAL